MDGGKPDVGKANVRLNDAAIHVSEWFRKRDSEPVF